MKKEFIFYDVDKLKGIGNQLSKYLKKRKIEKIKDIILNLPYSETDRSKIYKLNDKPPSLSDFKNTLKTPSGEPELGSGNFTVKK